MGDRNPALLPLVCALADSWSREWSQNLGNSDVGPWRLNCRLKCRHYALLLLFLLKYGFTHFITAQHPPAVL